MRIRRIEWPAIVLAGIITAACATPPPDITGSWESEVSEPELFLSGTERLTFKPDSTFISISGLKFAHGDSTLNSTLGFRISIDGIWRQPTANSITMTYNPESLEIDTIAGSFHLRTTRPDAPEIPDSVRNMMREGLYNQISGFYKTVYANSSAAAHVTLTELEVSGNPPILSAKIGNVGLSWNIVEKK